MPLVSRHNQSTKFSPANFEWVALLLQGGRRVRCLLGRRLRRAVRISSSKARGPVRGHCHSHRTCWRPSLIHGANGYLIDQFLRTTSNIRTDQYGGSRQNRLRFLKEVVAAVAEEIGASRTAIRLAPFLTARGMACPDILPTILEATEFLQAQGVGYLHLVEADWDDAPQFTESFRKEIRARFQGPIIVAGHYDLDKANWVLDNGYADLVAFGRPFVANPDLPYRLAQGLPLAGFDPATLFGGGEHGYTDYQPAREAA